MSSGTRCRSYSPRTSTEIATADGRLFLGRFQPARPGSTTLVTGDGQFVLALSTIVSARPIGTGFWKRLDGSLNLGFSSSRSSGVTQLNGSFDANYRRPSFESSLSTDTTLTRSEDTGDDVRLSTQLGYNRLRANRWFVGGFGRFERNESLGIDLRSTLGGLIGRRLIQAQRSRFMLAGGLSGNREQVQNADARSNLEAVLGASYSYFRYDSPKTDVEIDGLVLPSLSDAGRVRVELRTSVVRELWRDFVFSVSAYDSFDSRPPSAGALKNDAGVTTSVGWTF